MERYITLMEVLKLETLFHAKKYENPNSKSWMLTGNVFDNYLFANLNEENS